MQYATPKFNLRVTALCQRDEPAGNFTRESVKAAIKDDGLTACREKFMAEIKKADWNETEARNEGLSAGRNGRFTRKVIYFMMDFPCIARWSKGDHAILANPWQNFVGHPFEYALFK